MSHKYPCIYYDNGKCQKFSDEEYTAWCVFSDCESCTPSNADHIRSMTDEELSEFVHACDLGFLPWCDKHCEYKGDDGCDKCISIWLKQPYGGDT